MTTYLLPCSCGNRIGVTASQAGQAIRCTCGLEHQVPTLRGLNQLEQTATAGNRPAVVWEDRHRTAFLGVLLGLLALGIAGYLAWRQPPAFRFATHDEVAEILAQSSPQDLENTLRYFQRGIDYVPPEVTVIRQQSDETRTQMRWGIAIALVLALSGFVVAGASLSRSTRGHRST